MTSPTSSPGPDDPERADTEPGTTEPNATEPNATEPNATEPGAAEPGAAEETAALQDALAAEHVAVWGCGVLGAALPEAERDPVTAADRAHRDARDQLTALLRARDAVPVTTAAAYALPFPVVSAVDAAELGVLLEDGVTAAWVQVLGQAQQLSTRELALSVLVAAELRAVGWRSRAGRDPVTTAFPGL